MLSFRLSYNKKLSQFVKKFLLSGFIGLFDGKMLDKSSDVQNLLRKYKLNSAFITFESRKLCKNLENYIDCDENIY